MASLETPDLATLLNAPKTHKRWTPGDGEESSGEWDGSKVKMAAKYAELKAFGNGFGPNISQLELDNNKGRSVLKVQYGRAESNVAGNPATVTVIEELFAVDVIKDLAESPYFSTDGTALTNDEIAFAREAAENYYTAAEIDAIAGEHGKTVYGSWGADMQEYHWHRLHGMTSYYETAFVLRRSRHGIRFSSIAASFTGINTVVTPPTFQSEMSALIAALPEGEWLFRPPQATSLGAGKWRVEEEWHWAPKWSIVYGGTWQKP